MENKLKNRKGFTLAELLIVVAIIGVLVAISIPVFTNQLEKSREAADMANLRAAYAEAAAEAIGTDKNGVSKQVTITQKTAGFTDTSAKIGNVPVTDATLAAAVAPNVIYVNVSANGVLTFTTSASFTS